MYNLIGSPSRGEGATLLAQGKSLMVDNGIPLLAAIFLIALAVYSLSTGRIPMRGRDIHRAQDPMVFFLFVAMYVVASVLIILGVVGWLRPLFQWLF